jgi:hypothetical protein
LFFSQLSKDHITPAVLESFLDLTQYLVKLPTGAPLLKHLFDYVLFNPQLWVHTSVEVGTLSSVLLATVYKMPQAAVSTDAIGC